MITDNNSDSNSSNEVLSTIEKKGKASTQEPSTMFGKELGDCEFDSAPGPMVNTEVKVSQKNCFLCFELWCCKLETT